jgi:hypothetical protein
MPTKADESVKKTDLPQRAVDGVNFPFLYCSSAQNRNLSSGIQVRASTALLMVLKA